MPEHELFVGPATGSWTTALAVAAGVFATAGILALGTGHPFPGQVALAALAGGLVCLVAIGRAVALRRRLVCIEGDLFELRDRSGARRFRATDIRSIAAEAGPGGTVLRVEVDRPGFETSLRLVRSPERDVDSPFPDWVRRLVAGAIERGRREAMVAGPGWVLTGRALQVGGEGVALERVTDVRVFDGCVQVWLDGNRRAFWRCRLTSPNAFVLRSLLEERIARRPAPELGRLWFARRGPGLAVFEFGDRVVVRRTWVSRRTVPLGKVVALVSDPIESIGQVSGALEDRKRQRLVLLADRQPPLVYERTGRRPDPDLVTFRDHVAGLIAHRLEEAVARDGSVEWSPGRSVSRSELRAGDRAVALSDVRKLSVDDRSLGLWTDAEEGPALVVAMDLPNAWALWVLLRRRLEG